MGMEGEEGMRCYVREQDREELKGDGENSKSWQSDGKRENVLSFSKKEEERKGGTGKGE